MEGRRSLKPSTLVRFQPSAPKSESVLAWCTVHRRIYKPLRSRLEHGPGSTPSASTIRSKLIQRTGASPLWRHSSRGEQAILFLTAHNGNERPVRRIVRQLVRFQPDAPDSGTVAEW
jgi:hypothetical protein